MFKKRRSAATSPIEEESFRRLPQSWEPLDGGRERQQIHRGKRLAVFAAMYASIAVLWVLWDRVVPSRYDWTLIVACVAVMAAFALILRRQQQNARDRLVRRDKV